jgi:hypothetical protein
MNMHRNNLLTRKATSERAICAQPFDAHARPLFDRSPLMGRGDHGLALPEAGDSIA